ncbi:MAG TPA: DUF4837 family protein [Bacteroidales bacterium]|jgi:hypothetical protein|nr:DUF4837 family protein [Bacteroidales bacterium]
MRKLILPFSLVIVALIINGCTDVKNSGKANATGKSSEILIVCEKAQWDGIIGKSIKDLFGAEMEGLPESEARFSMVNVPYNSFSRYLQPHRNVFIVDVKPGNGKTQANVRQDVWSHPQRVVEIKAASDTAFVNYFNHYGEAICELFEQNELACNHAVNSLNRNGKAEAEIVKTLGLKMVIPSDFYLAKKENGFIWLRKETSEMSLGILIYAYPYTDTSQVSFEKICAERNQRTSQYIPGPSAGSYMLISDDVIKPVSKSIKFKNRFAVETRGLWYTKGDFMGGPFVNISVIDESKQRVVALDGFVYRPNKEKRSYIRQLESILWDADFDTAVVNKQSK